MLNEEVRKIMTKDPIVVGPNDLIKDVSNLMFEKQVQQIPVVDKGKFVGLITSFDLWQNSIGLEGKTGNTVKEVMTKRVVKIAPKDKVGTAAELFIDRRFKTLPVVNLRDELKGVVTAFDVIKHVFKKEYPVPILYKEILEAE
jgi:CBS domain-containing protein